jgi:hypothetical protein
VSLLLLQAEVWVVEVVVVVVKPALELGGFVTAVVVVVVPQSLVLSAWAAGENQTPPTAIKAARVVVSVKFLSDIWIAPLSESWIEAMGNRCDGQPHALRCTSDSDSDER